MKSDNRNPFERENLEERITAWLLGELNPDEIALLEERLKDHPELEAFKQQMAATIGKSVEKRGINLASTMWRQEAMSDA